MKRKWILFWIITASPLFISAALYAFLPATIPLHWDASGMVDNWAPKFPSVFLLPLTILLFSAITALLPRFSDDPDKDPGKLYSIMIYCIAILGSLLALSFLFLTLVSSF